MNYGNKIFFEKEKEGLLRRGFGGGSPGGSGTRDDPPKRRINVPTPGPRAGARHRPRGPLKGNGAGPAHVERGPRTGDRGNPPAKGGGERGGRRGGGGLGLGRGGLAAAGWRAAGPATTLGALPRDANAAEATGQRAFRVTALGPCGETGGGRVEEPRPFKRG